MTLSEVKELKRNLERYVDLDGNNLDLIEDAIHSLSRGNEYLAEKRLNVLAYNLRRQGDSKAADMVESVVG